MSQGRWRFTFWLSVTIVCYLIGDCAPLSLLLSNCYSPPTRVVSSSPSSWRRTTSTRSRKCRGCSSSLHAASRNSIQDALRATKDETQLPIFDILDQICCSLVKKTNLLLEAPPGAGKTTILPLALLSEGLKRRCDDTSGSTNNEDEDEGSDQKDEGTSSNMMLLFTNIWVVEPRRVAARAAATRMATILKESVVGQTVGYAVRGDTRISKQNTRITVVTDGVLLNRLRTDPELTGIDTIVFDEFHERGVSSDTALALCVEVQRTLRPELRLVVMSATLFDDDENGADDANGEKTKNKFLDTLGGDDKCQILVSSGRMYPIQIQWARKGYPPLGVLLKSRIDLVATMCDAIEEGLRLAPAQGDVLAFLPGAREIERVVQELTAKRHVNAEVLPLYGSVPKEKQDYAIFPSKSSDRRRVIVSSPIAEASLTLERVTCVIDSGLRREARCDVDTGMPRLVTTRCSKASARQRAGRAGRVQEGLCLRLYSEFEYESSRFGDHSPPEILKTDLVPTLLLLSDWGCSKPADVYEIPFVDPPQQSALQKAYETLVFLEALQETNDDRYVLTELGRDVAKLPAHPRLATAIVRADSREKLAAVVISASFLDDDTGGGRSATDAELMTRLRTLLESPRNSFPVNNVLQYAARISDEARDAVLFFFDNPSNVRDLLECVGDALLPGFVDLVAERRGDASYGGSTYMLSLGRTARLDDVRDSPNFVVVAETSTGDDGIARIRSYASISMEALHRVAKMKEMVYTVPSRSYEVRARRSIMIGALELSSTPLPPPSGAQVIKILLETVRSLGGVNSALIQNLPKSKKAELEGLRERIRLASGSTEWPVVFAALDALESGHPTQADIETAERILEPWLAAAGSLKVCIVEVLKASLTADQMKQLDRDFPLEIQAPDGTQIPIQYIDGVPTAFAKLQQFFGVTESPCVGPPGKRVPISLSLQSPAGKELARTVDLPYFWKETYPAIRAEMRGRYAKHPWPEDPLTAVATRQTKKQQLITTSSDSDVGKKKDATKSRKKRR